MRPLKNRCGALVMLCARQRPPGARKPSCGHHGASELRAWLKSELKREGLWPQKVRVMEVDCLDVCPKDGVMVGLDGGERLLLVDAEEDREALLAELLALARVS